MLPCFQSEHSVLRAESRSPPALAILLVWSGTAAPAAPRGPGSAMPPEDQVPPAGPLRALSPQAGSDSFSNFRQIVSCACIHRAGILGGMTSTFLMNPAVLC